MKMELKKLKRRSGNLITYDGKQYKALFEHCSGGMSGVGVRKYNDTVEPLLWLHGVTMIVGPESP